MPAYNQKSKEELQQYQDVVEEGVNGFFAEVMERMAFAGNEHDRILEAEHGKDRAFLDMLKPVVTYPEYPFVDPTRMYWMHRDMDVEAALLMENMTSSKVVNLWGKNFWLTSTIDLPLAISRALHGSEYD